MAATVQGTGVNDNLITLFRTRGLLTADQVGALRQASFPSQEALEEELRSTYAVSAEDILLTLAEHVQIPVVRLSSFSLREELVKLCPPEMLKRHWAVPLARTRSTLTLAMADPLNILAVEEIADYTKLRVIPVTTLKGEIQDILTRAEQASKQGLGDILKETSDAADLEVAKDSKDDKADLESMLSSAEDAPVVRVVNMILIEAMRKRASDIHIEPFEKLVRLRYRVDGMLQEQPAPPKVMQSAIISRIKIMSELDIAERRIPQDGRFRIRAEGKEIDLRVSILPCVHGEKIVMRLLDKTNLAKDLDSIGLDPDSLDKLRFAIKQPNGMIVITGPTGSGKTTTLYSALQELNTPGVNIVTVENPVEYQLPGINQVEIREAVGLTFAAALRSILRQDPNIVLVGETRDSETADIGVKAALTGHLVLTTLHTNDAPSAIARLVDMGVPPFLLASSLRLVQAQRLVRRICPNCKEPFKLTREYCEKNQIEYGFFEGAELFKGRGCSRCGDRGYSGRASIMEVLPISSAIRDLVIRNANASEVKKAALAEGFRDMRMNGFYRVRDGLTTIEEVLRVTSGGH